MSSKIEGIPEGWELVRIGVPHMGESYLDCYGHISVCDWIAKYVNFVIVRKIEPPKPTYIPWNFDTMPDCVRVKAKEDGTRFMSRPISESCCLVKMQICSYQYLLDHYTQLDGTPCGTVEVQ